jgi:hypothetical protein
MRPPIDCREGRTVGQGYLASAPSVSPQASFVESRAIFENRRDRQKAAVIGGRVSRLPPPVELIVKKTTYQLTLCLGLGLASDPGASP